MGEAVTEAPVPREMRVPVADGVSLRTLTWGAHNPTRPSMLLVHGLASSARLWDGMAAALAGEGWHAVAVDLRGHGESDRPDDGYGFEVILDDIRRVMEAHDLERPLFVGQSWGGNLAVEFGWAHPELVSGVVPVDGGLIDLRTRFADWEDCAVALRPPAPGQLSLAELEAMFRARTADWPETATTGYLACFEEDSFGRAHPRLRIDRHMKILRSLWAHRPQERFAHLQVPMLMILADSGHVQWVDDKRRAAQAAEQLVRRSRVEWFTPAHHDVHAQFPDAVAQRIIDIWTEGFFS